MTVGSTIKNNLETFSIVVLKMKFIYPLMVRIFYKLASENRAESTKLNLGQKYANYELFCKPLTI